MTRCSRSLLPSWALVLALLAPHLAGAQGGAVFRCPGKTGGADEFTNLISDEQARERGCRTIEGAPISIIQTAKPKPAVAAGGPSSGGGSGPAAGRPADSRVDPAAQRQRDTDARRILDDELRREEDRLAQQKREFNNGEPERRGDERNFQHYLDRVAQMKAALTRTEADIAALKRELAKLPP